VIQLDKNFRQDT